MRKSSVIYDIVHLIRDDVITVDDLEECSEELQDTVRFIIDKTNRNSQTIQEKSS